MRRALRLAEHSRDAQDLQRLLTVVREPVPTPGPGEVLVRVEASPCNPSDLIYLAGEYPAARPLPAIPGFEGAGTVVATGGGWTRLFAGRRVAFATAEDGDGSWCDYAVVPAGQCIPLPGSVPSEQGATTIVNPLTAWSMVDRARRERAPAIVHTAAVSQLGQQLLVLAGERRLPVIAVVRRADQADRARALGAAIAIDLLDDDADEQLTRACRELGASLAFDAIGATWPERLLRAMGAGSTCVVYGALGETTEMHLDLGTMLSGECRVEGFYLGRWMRRAPLLRRLAAIRDVRRRFATGSLATEIAERVDLDGYPAALVRYRGAMSRGKVMLVPHGAELAGRQR
ncbi:Alcohol dehydrogenase [Planctomycetes bacterium Pla86]|uniref:Alcohol dehydrogenase n=2 Tax=Engelhardtia mirabilis TaxID=2528011 RepID=A0A518BDL3_9BACT|nr:Alcohol dehydrogenase [Planctomycetes bacterium Pla133]QDU99390.1 Alcohol dehydrogenase [Planctomycetes bacterium Pla86]